MSVLLSASQAAKQVGKSVPTITRAIKNGKLSATKTDNGGYQIDPAELFRVWPAVSSGATHEKGNATGKMLDNEPPKSNDVTGVLEAEVKALRQRLEDHQAMLADLREDRDHWRDQAKAQTVLLTNQAQPPEAPGEARRGLFGFFGGRRASRED